ncbi:hypothetical protein [Streptomyces sp. NBC_01304]|uniref:hypothetical protein n=1 Tax=Streptomyces sp. NBC_01304 TaxID=2903818 RepID=UPI002E145DDB|nr:hypothetical protein OG430_42535 [Streptomyces sp. NBC_01304]
MDGAPYIDPDVDPSRPVCGICPSKRLPRDRFVVYDRPNRECPFNPDDGFRYTAAGLPDIAEGTPACVHPHKIGLEPDRIAPEYTPEPPDDEAATPRGRSRWRLFARGR